MKLLVVGAIHNDVIVETPRVPRLDETLAGTGVRYAFGGKGGNQAVCAGWIGRDTGVGVSMAACIGNDVAGDQAMATLQAAGVETSGVQRVNGPTGMSVALSLPDGGYGAVTVSASNQLLDAAKIVIPNEISLLVLQNELPQAINIQMIRKAQAAGVKVLLNAAPAGTIDAELLNGVDVLVVNRVEAADLCHVDESALNPREAVQSLRAITGARVVLTLGGEGLWLADGDDIQQIEAHDVKVRSTHGAGDAFVGALCVRLAHGSKLSDAARYANAVAALHVSSPPEERDAITAATINALLNQTSSL